MHLSLSPFSLYSEARVRSAMVNQTGEFSDDGVSDDDGVDIMEYDIGVENVAEMNRVSQASSKVRRALGVI